MTKLVHKLSWFQREQRLTPKQHSLLALRTSDRGDANIKSATKTPMEGQTVDRKTESGKRPPILVVSLPSACYWPRHLLIYSMLSTVVGVGLDLDETSEPLRIRNYKGSGYRIQYSYNMQDSEKLLKVERLQSCSYLKAE
jgi:hypothetical protein